ncbi:MAG: flagellar biosynthesis repressor FlbT [Alphaproteobacteria bacterium]|nr:flagellar biosynthesis repressor FlbT [Alphaproteobacteria bacterium]
MALVIDLKPGEKILIGEAVITNDSQRTRLHIAGDAPILREKDVMQEQEADSPCKRIYFLLQCMYLSRNPTDYHQKFFDIVREIRNAAPSTAAFFLTISEHVLQGSYYKAMKTAKDLIAYERELIDHALQQPAK